MGKIFTLSANVKAVIQQVLDDFLVNNADGGLGKTCVLVYPPTKARCVNCIFDPVNNRSSCRPVSGAPVPFAPGGTCPLCSGTSICQTAATEEITLKCNWEFKKFLNPPGDLKLRVPHSYVEVKSYMSDVPKLLKAEALLVNLPIAPFMRQVFQLYGEPGDPSSIVPGRYAVSYWTRKT